MAHQITINDVGYEPSRSEKTLLLIFRLLFGVPIAILRTFLFVLMVRLVNRLLRRILATHLKARLTTSDRQVIAEMHPALVELMKELDRYYSKLKQVELPGIFFLDGAVLQLGMLVDEFKDLELAYSIFLEPVERKHTVIREYQILRNGRRNLSYSYPNQATSIIDPELSFGQMILPESKE